MTSSKDRGETTPFEKMVDGLLRGEIGHRKVEDIHPQDFQIIMDAIAYLFFNQKSKRGSKLGVEGFSDYDGTKVDFSKDAHYPMTRKDRKGNYKIIVLPDNGDSEEIKQIRVREAIKDFDCLEAVEKYEICLRIFHTFAEPELITLAKEYDPLRRDTSQLEKRLSARAKKRSDRDGAGK